MAFVDQSIFIARDTVFGQEFGPKLIAALLGAALVAWDGLTRRRLDYLWVYLTGTLIWGGAELALQTSGIRQMPSHLLFGHELAPVVAQLIQGAAEGATMAIMGLVVADRWLADSRRVGAYAAFAVFAAALVWSSLRAQHGDAAEVGSRRDVLNPTSLLFIAVLLAVSLVAAWRHPWSRQRLFALFLTMVGLGAVWTVSQVMVGGRWVEISDAAGGFTRAGPALTAVVLSLDVIFEIAVVYLPFLALPILIGLIRDADPSRTGRLRESHPESSRT